MTSITDISGAFTLHNGVQMPYLGLGVFQSKKVVPAIEYALSIGYRHIDTAAIYRNEREVGQVVRQSGITREEIFVTSKVWNSDQGYETTLRAFDTSMKRLGLDILDLYLIHWPVAGKFNETWRALEHLYHQGRVRAIGVSNFLKHHLEKLFETSEIIPMVNQMEFHPWLVQQDLLDFCTAHQIQYEAWAPIMRGKIFDLPLLQQLASKYDVAIPQIVLRWNLQKGVVTIPKSENPDRIKMNADLFYFDLTDGDIARIDGLDRNVRFGPDPDTFDF